MRRRVTAPPRPAEQTRQHWMTWIPVPVSAIED
jgi:hypothetical protein